MYETRYYQEECIQAGFDFFGEYGGSSIEANPLFALPTGTGKSLTIAEFDKRALTRFPGTRVLNATHVKELIAGNAQTAMDNWPGAPIGVYSASLKAKQYDQSIIYGGIQSMAKNPDVFGFRDYMKVDEAHLVSPEAEANYIKLITAMKAINPRFRVMGYTATPYRLGLGSLLNGGIFTHMPYNITDINGFNRLLAEGYLCKVIPKQTETILDLSGVGLNEKGDFRESQVEAAIDNYKTTWPALKEIVEAGRNRSSWMIFAASIKHAEHITQMLRDVFGIPTVCVHSKMSPMERDANLELFQSGQARCIVNKDILTTGFDHPPLDLIAVLRPTMSTGLWVQMLGRGTRPYNWLTSTYRHRYAFRYIKTDCLVLDFAQNTARLGPINDPVIPLPRGQGKPGDAPVKICPVCGVYNHSNAQKCDGCDYEFGGMFTLEPILDATASTEELIRSESASLPDIQPFTVQKVIYDVWTSRKTGFESLRATYYCNGLKTFWEYKSFEAPAKKFSIHKAHDWLKQRWNGDMPETNREAEQLSPMFRIPKTINVWVNKPGKPPEVMSHEF